jgi:hypothetical protein
VRVVLVRDDKSLTSDRDERGYGQMKALRDGDEYPFRAEAPGWLGALWMLRTGSAKMPAG